MVWQTPWIAIHISESSDSSMLFGEIHFPILENADSKKEAYAIMT
jgi:hypothetical protein